jgi:hypothetical protein
MTSTGSGTASRERTGSLQWILAAALAGLFIGLFVPITAVLMRPNEKPQAVLKENRVQGRVGDSVTLDASLSHVPNRPDARLRVEWLDTSNRVLLPAGVDPEGARARLLVVHGVAAGEREIILRVTHTSRCHRFAKLWISPTYCEVSDEARAHLDFRPADCKPGRGLPADELVLEGARLIGSNDRDAECRLVLPQLIVTNGHSLEIRDTVPVEAAAGGSRIVAFRAAPPNAASGAAGVGSPNAIDGQPGAEGGNGAFGQPGQEGRDAGPIVIVAPSLLGQLSIENNGQAGGRGGIGGRGGQGGKGGNTMMASATKCDRLAEAQAGGRGGASGRGGVGGRGGNAGKVRMEVTRPVASPNRVTISADGGAGGAGGPAGYPGRGGKGGFGVTRVSCPSLADGPEGPEGERGSTGPMGATGAPAAITVRDGNEDRSRQPGHRTIVNLPVSP